MTSYISFQTHSDVIFSQWKDGQKHLWIFSDLSQVELDFLLSLKDESFKYCLSDGGSVGGLPGLAWLLGVPFSLYLLIVFGTPALETCFPPDKINN